MSGERVKNVFQLTLLLLRTDDGKGVASAEHGGDQGKREGNLHVDGSLLGVKCKGFKDK